MKNLFLLFFLSFFLFNCKRNKPVSADIINAFFSLPQLGDNEMADLDSLLLQLKTKIADRAGMQPVYDAGKTIPVKLYPLLDKIKELRSAITNEGGFYLYEGDYKEESLAARKARYEVEGYNNFVLTEDIKLEAKPVDKRNKDITERILIEDGKGEELKNTINKTRTELLKVIDNLSSTKIEGIEFDQKEIAKLKEDLALEEQNDKMAKENGKESWAAYMFLHMPVAACYPLLRKYENDGKNSAAQIVNFILNSIKKD